MIFFKNISFFVAVYDLPVCAVCVLCKARARGLYSTV